MRLLNYIRKRILSKKYCKDNIFISSKTTVSNCSFEPNVLIHDDCLLVNCSVGRGTYIGEHCTFKNTEIGRWCSVAPDVKLVSGKHPTSKYVSMHPAFYLGKTVAGVNFEHKTDFCEFDFNSDGKYLTVGNDVWIASDVLIVGGVKIGDGAVVASGSVVTNDVPPYAIVGGVPAKVIKYRFEPQKIEKLCEMKWWEKDTEWIKQNISHFDDIDAFLNPDEMQEQEV